jgi:flagellar hook-associated protein FlgK
VDIAGSGANGTFTTRQDMVDAINAATSDTGVAATMDSSSEITLSNADSAKAGEDIVLGPLDDGNALGVASGTYSKVYAEIDVNGAMLVRNGSGADISITTLTGGGNVLGLGNGTYRGQLDLASTDDIRIGFTAEHTEDGAAELAKLGLRTGVYIDGAAQEDLLVFVSKGSGTVAGSFDASMTDPAALDKQRINALRDQKFDITFTSANRYQITWTNPANGLVTQLAERDYDPKAGIEYQGVQLMLNRLPAAGDKFVIDGNQDGTGNNQNMLDIVALQTRGFIGGKGGKTISQTYEEEVGKVGNFSSQATIAQKALQVVNDQAIEARDKVSGVSLDAEAADLIRFQQAYQANAKSMQIANELFDSILQAAR